jgi:hypothetical protein
VNEVKAGAALLRWFYCLAPKQMRRVKHIGQERKYFFFEKRNKKLLIMKGVMVRLASP